MEIETDLGERMDWMRIEFQGCSNRGGCDQYAVGL